MLQEMINGLTLIVVENDLLETIKYEDLVDEFASKSVWRNALFKYLETLSCMKCYL